MAAVPSAMRAMTSKLKLEPATFVYSTPVAGLASAMAWALAKPMPEAAPFWFPPFGGDKVDPSNFSARIRGSYTPQVSGVHRFGIYSAGFSRMFVDGLLVADAWSGWKKGRTVFEEGCDEVVGEADLTAGTAHQIVIDFGVRPSDNLVLSALRAGIARPLSDADIAEAARVAVTVERMPPPARATSS